MAAKLARLTHKIAIQLHLEIESCIICSSRCRRPVRKLLDTPSYVRFLGTRRIGLRGGGGLVSTPLFAFMFVRAFCGFMSCRVMDLFPIKFFCHMNKIPMSRINFVLKAVRVSRQRNKNILLYLYNKQYESMYYIRVSIPNSKSLTIFVDKL
jgi:hypothetical protein